MLLSDFKSNIRLEVPGATVNVVSDGQLVNLINRGAKEVNSFAKAYLDDIQFDVTADKATYNIIDDITSDFRLMDESGIYWSNGTEWKQLDPATMKYLDEYFPNWRNASSGSPQYYVPRGNEILFYPPPDTTLSSGFWIYYVKAASPMTNDAHYPFTGSTVEIPWLRDLDEAIIDFVRMKLAKPLGKDQRGIITMQEYRATLQEKTRQIRRRPDLQKSRFTRMRIPSSRGGRRI